MKRRRLARGITEVRKQDGPRFRVRFKDHEGKRRCRTFIDYHNAVSWLRERQVETERIKSGLAPVPKPPVATLRDYAAEVVRSRMFRSGPKHRAAVARIILNHWPELLDRPVDEITRRDVKLGLGRLSQELGSATVNRALSALSRVLREAHEDELVSRNVCFKLRLPERSNVATALVLDEVRRLLAAAEPCYRPLFAALLYTAGRKTDVLELRWQQVRFEQGLIIFLDTKNGDDVPVSLHPELEPYLRWIIAELYAGEPPPAGTPRLPPGPPQLEAVGSEGRSGRAADQVAVQGLSPGAGQGRAASEAAAARPAAHDGDAAADGGEGRSDDGETAPRAQDAGGDDEVPAPHTGSGRAGGDGQAGGAVAAGPR